MLQRDATTGGFASSPVPKPLNLRITPEMMADSNESAIQIREWFDKTVQSTGNRALLTVAEMVAQARRITFLGKDGKQHTVGEFQKAQDAENIIRNQAKFRGTELMEHRDMSDAAGVQSELQAVMENLGGIPTSVKLGGDKANLQLHIAGKVTGEVAIGGAKLEAQGSAEGGEATIKLPGGGEIGAKGGPEGGGGSFKKGDVKGSLDITKKGAKAELKAGDLTIKGGIEKAEGGAEWSADIEFGNISALVTPAEIATVMQGASKTFGDAAEALGKGADPKVLIEQGGAVKDAVSKAVEKAKKSAEQKPGFLAGASVKGSPAGGVSVMFTLTIVF